MNKIVYSDKILLKMAINRGVGIKNNHSFSTQSSENISSLTVFESLFLSTTSSSTSSLSIVTSSFLIINLCSTIPLWSSSSRTAAVLGALVASSRLSLVVGMISTSQAECFSSQRKNTSQHTELTSVTGLHLSYLMVVVCCI